MFFVNSINKVISFGICFEHTVVNIRNIIMLLILFVSGNNNISLIVIEISLITFDYSTTVSIITIDSLCCDSFLCITYACTPTSDEVGMSRDLRLVC